MKIIAISGDCVLVETETEFIFYDSGEKTTVKHKKKDNPELGIAAMAKWRYLELKKPRNIKSLDEINEDLMKELDKNTWGEFPYF